LPDVQHVSDFVVILSSGRVSVAKPMAELAQPLTPALQVRTLGPPDQLQDALQRLNLDTKLSATGLLIVSGDSEQCVRAIWQAAAEQGTVIRSLIPARNSMETIFLEAVQSLPQQSNHADS